MAPAPVMLAALLGVVACTPRGEPSRAEARRIALAESPRVTGARALGEALFHGRGGCTACHRLGDDGEAVVGPNLRVGPDFPEPLARRAHVQGPVLDHVVEALVDPDAVVVAGYPAGKMPRVEEPPMALDDDEILALAVFIASLDAEHPLSAAALDGARARVAVARQARLQRAGEKRVRELVARVRLEGADPALGPQVFVQSGCAGCHGQPTARPLQPPSARGGPSAVLQWLAEKLPRRASCTHLGRPSDLAALAAWLAAL